MDDSRTGNPCLICGSDWYERHYAPTPDGWEPEWRCVECGSPEGTAVDTFDWSIYITDGEDASLFDLRYGVHDLTGLMLAMRRALTHGDIEVKVKAR